MIFWKSIFYVFCLFICGCANVDYVKKLDDPIPLEKHGTISFHYFNGSSNNEGVASIGDVVFVFTRFEVNDDLTINSVAPLMLAAFPKGSEWMATHSFNYRETQGLVYTSPAYYKGNIGVILDKNYRPLTPMPLIQLAGNRKGRRWPLLGSAENFFVTSNLVEAWGIRYGGKQNGEYVFEIIDKLNANVSQVIQSVRVSDRDLVTGVIIKGVRVKLLELEGQGVIRCSLQYTRSKPIDRKLDL